MATTQEQVAQELQKSGRLADDYERLFADWRAKGLLPPLATGSRGRAGGRLYWWDEDDIVDRAKTVFDLLARHHSADAALVSISLLACSTPPPVPLVRAAWLRALEKEIEQFERRKRRYGEDDVHHVLAARHATAFAKRLGVARSSAVEMMAEISAILFVAANTDTTSVEELFKDLFKAWVQKWVKQPELADRFRKLPAVGWLMAWISNCLTRDVLRESLGRSSCEALRYAYDQWLSILEALHNQLRMFRTAASTQLPQPSVRTDGLTPERQFAVMAGHYAVPSLVWANARNYTSKVDQTIEVVKHAFANEAFQAIIPEYAANRPINQQGQQILFQTIAKLSEIWGPQIVAGFLIL
jgi:hypothetical protein